MIMENLIKTTFDKLEMDSEAKMTIKNNLLHARKRNYTWMRYAACAATFIAVLFMIPTTRAAIVNAAEYLTRIFHSADGAEIIYEETDNMVKFSFEISDTGYTEISDGRLYFVLGDVREDVTDLCSESTYYRYELANSDGSKSVIFVGGTVTDNGWIELLFDADGNYVFGKRKVHSGELADSDEMPAWADAALRSEDVQYY